MTPTQMRERATFARTQAAELDKALPATLYAPSAASWRAYADKLDRRADETEGAQ